MKNRLFGLILIGMLMNLSFYGQKFSMGITSGLNVATFSKPGNIYDNEALKTGFGGGLAFQYAISPSFAVQSGLIYEQKGFRRKSIPDEDDQKYSGTFNYLTLPLVAAGSVPLTGNVRLYGITGFYAGYKTYTENALVVSNNEVSDTTGNNKINNADFGWIIGGGIQLPAGNHCIQAGFKYSSGLQKVIDSQPEDRNKSVLFAITLFF